MLARRAKLGAARRGAVFLAVLGAALVVAILGLSAMAVVRLEYAAAGVDSDAIKARLFAESGVELAILETDQNALWRTTYAGGGPWMTDKAIGDGTYSVEGMDPYDGVLGDSPRDPVRVVGTGVKGQARHMIRALLVDTGNPLVALGSALHSAGEVRVIAGRTLRLSGAPVTTNGVLRNEGTIDGDAAGTTILNTGTITGTTQQPTAIRPVAAADVIETYRAMGTLIPTVSILENVVLAPGYTSVGPTNPDGIYVMIAAGGGLIVRNCRIDGTLVVVASGQPVTVEGSVCMTRYREDCPALIVDGDCVLRPQRAMPLSESTNAVNFNPPGAAYQGATDGDTTDQYPSQIEGLVHVRGWLRIEQTPLVIGSVLCDASDLADTVLIDGDAQIQWNPALLSRPPMGYSTTPKMRVRQGTWERAVLP